MRTLLRSAAMATMVWAIGPGAAIGSQQAPTVMLLLKDSVGVSSGLVEARMVVSGIYQHAGVRIEWVQRWQPGVITIKVVGGVTEDAIIRQSEVGPQVLGFASADGRLAYVFHDRTSAVRLDKLDLALALVISHEVGHVLLGQNSHAATGIMKAHINPTRMQYFARDQALEIRRRVSATVDSLTPVAVELAAQR